MQDLREKFLKAGLVDKKQAREAKQEARREKKRQGGARADADRIQAQEERFVSKQLDQAAKAREIQEALNRQREEDQLQNRIRNIIRSHLVWKWRGDDYAFFCLGRDSKIRKINIRYEILSQLSSGQIAIVETDDDPQRDYALIDSIAAKKIEELDHRRILFWNKPGERTGDRPECGSGKPAQ